MKKHNQEIKKIEKLILLTKRKVTLLEELKESLKYEKCRYSLDLEKTQNYRGFTYKFSNYQLSDIKNKKILIAGSKQLIKSFLKLRKINPESIYNYNLINKH